MNIYLRLLFLSLLLILSSCSASETTLETKNAGQLSERSENNYPEWFTFDQVSSDSTSFTAVSTSLSADSSLSALTSERKARMMLEKYVGDQLEDIRMDVAADGDESVNSPSFILALRNAHQLVEERAQVLNVGARAEDDAFRGFSRVYINKESLVTLLANSLGNYQGQWNKMKQADSFEEFSSK